MIRFYSYECRYLFCVSVRRFIISLFSSRSILIELAVVTVKYPFSFRSIRQRKKRVKPAGAAPMLLLTLGDGHALLGGT